MYTVQCTLFSVKHVTTQYTSTTVYKAGFSTPDDLYNLVTKIITNYPVLTNFKILKIKKNNSNFFIILRILKFVRTG